MITCLNRRSSPMSFGIFLEVLIYRAGWSSELSMLLSSSGLSKTCETSKVMLIFFAAACGSNVLHISSKVSMGSKTSVDKENTPSLSCLRSSKSSMNDDRKVSWTCMSLPYLRDYRMRSIGNSVICNNSMICFRKNWIEKRGVLISWLTVDVKFSDCCALSNYSKRSRRLSLSLIFLV